MNIVYKSKVGHVYFEKKGIVYRSVLIYPFENSTDPIRFEGEIFGLEPCPQPKEVFDIAERLEHPANCVMDIEATINLLKYRVLDKSLISNLRKRI